MGGSYSRHPHYKMKPQDLKYLKSETGFKTAQLERLFRRFQHLDKEGKGYLTKEELIHIHEIVLNPIGERIVDMFFHKSDKLYFEQFAKTFAIFRPVNPDTPSYGVNSREAKTKFLFSLVDSDEDGHFCHDEIHDLLEMMMGAKISEEQISQITSRVIDEADSTGTGHISFTDFKKATAELDIEGSMAFISFN